MSKREERLEEFRKLVASGKPKEDIMYILNIQKSTYYNLLKLTTTSFTKKPSTIVSIDDIKKLRRDVYTHKKAKEDYYRNNLVTVVDSKPIGILHFGDLHLDSDGVDLDLVDSHIQLLRNTEGLYGGNLGDSTNNWIGFLGKLYGEQTTTIEQSVQLLEEYLKDTHFLYTIVGNHDKWNGGEYVIRHIVDSGIIGEDIRFTLRFPNGTTTTIHARHNFIGNSMYNPAHGAVKEALTASRDDIVIHGHKHSTGYSVIADSEKHKLLHCISVGSYKVIDSYKTMMGFRDDNISPCVLTTIDPSLPEEHTDRIKVFYDPFVGVQYLNFLRNK